MPGGGPMHFWGRDTMSVAAAQLNGVHFPPQINALHLSLVHPEGGWGKGGGTWHLPGLGLVFGVAVLPSVGQPWPYVGCSICTRRHTGTQHCRGMHAWALGWHAHGIHMLSHPCSQTTCIVPWLQKVYHTYCTYVACTASISLL